MMQIYYLSCHLASSAFPLELLLLPGLLFGVYTGLVYVCWSVNVCVFKCAHIHYVTYRDMCTLCRCLSVLCVYQNLFKG